MKKLVSILAVVGFVALLSIPVTAQPNTAMAPTARPAAMAPVMKTVPKPKVSKPVPKPKASKPKTVAKLTVPTTPVTMATVAAPKTTPAAPASTTPAAMTVTKEDTKEVAPTKTTTEAKQDSKGSVVGGWILQAILYLLGIFLTAFIPIFTAWLYKKLKITNLEHKAAIDAAVIGAAVFGIGKAEEAAHKLKDNPISGAEKLNIALEAANQKLRESGLPEKGAEYLTSLIEAQLGLNRKDEKVPTVTEKKEEEEKAEEEEKTEAAEEKPEK